MVEATNFELDEEFSLGSAPKLEVQYIYYINDNLDKRTWTYIFGACCAATNFTLSFHNYRIWSFLGLIMTTYTAWYLTIASIIHEQISDLKKKQENHLILLKQKQRNEATKKLQTKIDCINVQKVQLQHKIKQEAKRFRQLTVAETMLVPKVECSVPNSVLAILLPVLAILVGQIPDQLFQVAKYNFTGNNLNCGFNHSHPCASGLGDYKYRRGGNEKENGEHTRPVGRSIISERISSVGS